MTSLTWCCRHRNQQEVDDSDVNAVKRNKLGQDRENVKADRDMKYARLSTSIVLPKMILKMKISD